MTNPMDYKGRHRKYVPGTSEYAVYYYGDLVERNGISYVCSVPQTFGYLPEEAESGFMIVGDGVGAGATFGDIDGGTYNA
jgi:hypothetical protein